MKRSSTIRHCGTAVLLLVASGVVPVGAQFHGNVGVERAQPTQGLYFDRVHWSLGDHARAVDAQERALHPGGGLRYSVASRRPSSSSQRSVSRATCACASSRVTFKATISPLRSWPL